ncbi:hypothetical protein V501_03558 [Pseudogymnoascus sp. VKM F-4519 (FW-2642)]|nr:hypothetical protein V501_03558 [Pseudogymnoascus sp. VKM F-4519 (FW-2642)]
MMLLKHFLPLSPLLLTLTSFPTLKRQGNGNITVSFFPTSEKATCKQDNIANAVSLTTSSIPTGYVCFNLTDLFTQPSDTGSQIVWKIPDDAPTQGVDYLLSNRASYNTDTNYTNVWYQQVNQTGDIKPDADGTWVLYLYAFADCIQNGGDAFDLNDFPWFETSCQTKDGGECQQLPQPVKSFAIGPAAKYNAGHGQCEVWAKFGGAEMLNRRGPALLVVAATMSAFLVL